MTQKIIVADDSQTIQKVVAITLASDSFELVTCLSEVELMKKATSNDYALILIDFNLSDSLDGYQLVSAIKKIAPTTPVMAMMGTFDQIDESKMKAAGIADFITKPFDSNIFIQKCRSLASDFDSIEEGEDQWDEDTKEDLRIDRMALKDEGADSEENWVVNSSQVENEEDEAEAEVEDEALAVAKEDQNNFPDDLQDELAGWGVPIPAKIGTSNAQVFMPPVIDKTAEASLEEGLEVNLAEDLTSVENEEAFPEAVLEEGEVLGVNPFEKLPIDEKSLPESEDLEYPDMEAIGSSLEDLKDIKLSSQLVAVDELAPETDSNPQLKVDLDEASDLASEIEAEESPDEFWAADEEIGGEEDSEASVGGAIANPDIAESVSKNSSVAEEIGLAPEQSNLSLEKEISWPEVKKEKQDESENKVVALDEEKLVAKIKESLVPVIEEMIKGQMEAMMKERVDHIAWEVIPDLAENLIRDEIKNISTEL